MTTYAIGDLQGCCDPLRRLLDQLHFDPARDRLLLTGDLVNRGPQSLEALRFVHSLGTSAVTVLGNHDLHLLAVAAGGKTGRHDTLDAVLRAPDRDELLHWLSRQPLAYREPASDTLLVHAGLLPQWTVAQALELAREAEAVIRSPEAPAFYAQMYGNTPDRWDDGLQGPERLRLIVNALTRLRYCDAAGRMDFRHKGGPGHQPAGLLPWFAAPGRRSAGTPIVFGHWSTLGQVTWTQEQVHGLDTGCVWGGCLTALELDSRRLYTQSCAQYRRPGAAQGD